LRSFLKVFRFATAGGKTVSKCGSEETRNREEARLRMGEGREFQSLGAATEKARD